MKKIIFLLLFLVLAPIAIAQYYYNPNLLTTDLDAGGNAITNATSVEIDTDGVLLDSDNDGSLCFTGQGDGNDEDLCFNLDDTADAVVLSSTTGVDTLDTGTLGLTVGGALSIGSTATDDINISGATPLVNLIDTSGVGDVNALIGGDLTDIGDGTEDFYLDFQVQENGTLSSKLAIDGAGTIQLKDDTTVSPGSFSIGSTTPTINFYDSNGADQAINGYIVGNLTDTGSGTQDFNIDIYAMEGGVAVPKISIDADAAIAFTDPITISGNVVPSNGTLLFNDLNNEGTCTNGTPDAETINLGLGNRHILDQEDAACELSFTGGANVPFGIHIVELQYAGDFAWTFATGAMYNGDTFDETLCTNFQATAVDGDILTLTVLAMDNDTVNVLSCTYNDQ